MFRAFAVVFLLFSLLFLVVSGRKLFLEDADLDFWMTVIALLFPLAGGAKTAYAFVSRIVFSEDSVEQISYLGRKTVPFASIRGRREIVVRGDPTALKQA